MLIPVPKRFSWDALEESFARLTEASGKVDLQLPIQLQNLHSGGVSTLLQLVTTWIRTKKSGNIHTFIGSGGASSESNVDTQIDRFLEYPHTIIASCHAEHIFGHNNQDITILVRKKALEVLEKSREFLIPEGKGRRFHLICEDISGATGRGLHPFFYDRQGPGLASVRNVRSMSSQIRALLDRQVPIQSWKPDAQIFEQLGIIVHELFDNTHVWARDDLERQPIVPSYRGVLFHCHTDYARPAETIATEIGGTNSAVTTFLNSCTRADGRMLPILEITVFDCGPTLPARAGRDIHNKLVLATKEEEYDVAIRTFLLWKSSAAELNRGRGLERVLRAVNACEGFLSLRTARLNVYRDLKKEPFTHASAWATTVIPGVHPMRDFLPPGARGTGESFAAGTFITLLIPLRQRSSAQG